MSGTDAPRGTSSEAHLAGDQIRRESRRGGMKILTRSFAPTGSHSSEGCWTTRSKTKSTSNERAEMRTHTTSTRHRAKMNAKTANSVSLEIPGTSQRSKHSVRGARNVTSRNSNVPNWSNRLIWRSYSRWPSERILVGSILGSRSSLQRYHHVERLCEQRHIGNPSIPQRHWERSVGIVLISILLWH